MKQSTNMEQKKRAKKQVLARADKFLLNHGYTRSQIARFSQFDRLLIYELKRPIRKAR